MLSQISSMVPGSVPFRHSLAYSSWPGLGEDVPQGSGTKPQHQFSVCAKCGHPLVDEPPFNKDYYWNNKKLEGEWLNMNSQMQEYLITKCNPLLDKKGAIITALKSPTYQEEVLICHCWHNFQSPISDETMCVLNCYDSK